MSSSDTSNPSPQESFPQYFNEDYDVIGILGRGGMGTVYKAIHKNLNREVALKVLERTSTVDSAESIKRFNLEAQAMKKLDHQNIVQVYDFGQEGQQFYIAMTYAQGITLSDLLRRRRKLDLDEAVLITRQVARGLLYAHNKGIIHRDIKPSNIIVAPDNRVYITDFGISYIQDSDRLTSTGTAMGTPEYMSPEQCQGEEITFQSDIYSLGIILYEMLCGDPPFTGTKPLDIAYKQVHNAPEPPSSLRPDIPVLLQDLIMRSLRKNRTERHLSMVQFLEELDKAMQLEPEPHQTTGSSSKIPTPKTSTRKLQSMIQRKDRNDRLIPLAFGLIVVLTLLQVLLVLIQREQKPGIHFLRGFKCEASVEERSLERDGSFYNLDQLWDGDLSTAWLLPGVDHDPPVLTIRFEEPVLITSLGFAGGYQKSRDDELQDRFTMFRKPRKIRLKTQDGSVQTIELLNIRGTQYPRMRPMELQELQVEFASFWPGSSSESDMALSELRILGISLFP